MRTLLLGTVFVANTAIIGAILNSSVTTDQLVGLIANKESESGETAPATSPSSKRAISPAISSELAHLEAKVRPAELNTPGSKTTAAADSPSGGLTASGGSLLDDNPFAAPKPVESGQRDSQTQDVATTQIPAVANSASPSRLQPLPEKTHITQDPASDDLAALVQKLEGELTAPATPSIESHVSEEVSLTIVRKPKMTAFVTSFEGITENGILSPENNYRITLSTDIPTGMLSFATFPADGHTHRIDDFPGYCERIAYGETKNGQEAVWIPAWSESGIEKFDKFSEAIFKPYLRTDFPNTDEISKLGLWVVCTDQKLNDSRPFSSPDILKYMSGLELGKPTFIFQQ